MFSKAFSDAYDLGDTMSRHPTDKQMQDTYALAKERYAQLGVDTDRALDTLAGISISLHCWQGDDVTGLKTPVKA